MSTIIESLRKFFDWLFGPSQSNPTEPTKPGPTKPEPAPPHQDNETPDEFEDDPQDGSEIRRDTVITIIDENTLTIIDEGTYEELEKREEESTSTSEETKPETETTDETETEEESTHEPKFMWCLDNGHGEDTDGKRSPLFDDGETRFFEYEFNRDIVNRIIKQLDELGIKYFNVVPEITDISLEDRVARANQLETPLNKLFISVHSNAAPTDDEEDWAPPNTKGIETFFFRGSTSGMNLAAVMQKQLIKHTQWRNRKIKPAGFFVIRNTAMPAILTENGFFNNKEEAALLMKDEVRQKIADAHVAAIMQVEKEGLT